MATTRTVSNVKAGNGRGPEPRRLTVVIGSSSEALTIAEPIKVYLEKRVPCDVDLWTTIFKPGHTTLATLIKEAKKVDFAVLVFHPDDAATVRGKSLPITRDNVVFEYGLFMGHLGPERTFALRPADTALGHLSDDAGFNYLPYRLGTDRRGPDVLEACIALHESMVAQGGRESAEASAFGSRPFEVLERSGITKVYPFRRDATNDMLDDLEQARESVRLYARVYISEFVKHEEFPKRLALAAANSKNLVVRWVSCDAADKNLMAQLYAIEDPKSSRWKDEAGYVDHLRGARSAFEEVVAVVSSGLKKAKKVLTYEHRAFDRYVPPYSMLLLDDRIAYVSLYKASGFGTYSPTLRIDRTLGELEGGLKNWIGDFLPPDTFGDPPHVKP